MVWAAASLALAEDTVKDMKETKARVLVKAQVSAKTPKARAPAEEQKA